MLINIAVAICLAWASSLWIGQFISGRMSPITPYKSPQVEVAAQPHTGVDYSVLFRRNLFNPAGRFIPADGGAITACTLPIKLMGTIITDGKNKNMAIILSQQDKQQELYKVGDNVLGALITGISRFDVLLNNSGRMERLSIDFGDETPGMANLAKSGIKGAHLSPGTSMTTTGEGSVLMDRRYFESQKGNMNDMMTQIRAIPNMAPDGSINGFQLFEITKESMYEKIGLKNQDVLQRVNGRPLNTVETGLDLFNALKNDNHFVLDIVRNKENKTIKVDIQ